MTARRWRSQSEPGSDGWHAQLRIGRCEIGYHVYRHESRHGDRWVAQPFAIYNRKASA